MQVVYFPEALCDSVPGGALSYFYTAPDNLPANMVDIVRAIQRGEVVTIRPATETELNRAEAIVALVQIGGMIAEKVGVLLDQDPEHVLTGRLTEMREAMESSVRQPPELLDRKPGDPRPFSDLPPTMADAKTR